MPKTKRQVRKQFKRSLPPQPPIEFVAVIGDRSGNYYAGGNNIYVREIASGQKFVVKNLVVPNIPGRLVKIRKEGGDLYVVGYWAIYGTDDNQETIVPPHDHRYPSPDFTPIDLAQMMPFNVWPNSGFTVQIFGGVFTKLDRTKGIVLNQLLDLSSYQPSSGALIVHLQYDDNGTVSVVQGTAVDSKGILSTADIPEATERSMHIAIRLYDGQESIRRDGTIDDFYDWRFMPGIADNAIAVDGIEVDNRTTPPTDGQVMAYDAYLDQYIPADAGAGDMLKSVYDTDNDGVVDVSEDTYAIDGITVDNTTTPPTDGQVPTYDIYTDKFVPATPSGGVAGSDTQVQYNDGGSLAGASGITYDKAGGITAITNLTISQVFKQAYIAASTITSNQNDYAPTGYDACTGIIVTSDAAYNITGLAGGSTNRVLYLHNQGSYDLTLTDDDSASSAANRFDFGEDIVLGSKKSVWLFYQASNRWKLLATTGGSGGSTGIPVDGWNAYSAVIPTRASADDPTYVLTFASVDLTGLISVGMKLKWTQNSTVRYGIVTAISFSTNTTLTLYGGTDYDVDDTSTYAISNFYYSPVKTPLGFPLEPSKWTVTATDSNDPYKTSPTQNVWYGGSNAWTSGSNITIDIPIGAWKATFSSVNDAQKASSPTTVFSCLSSDGTSPYSNHLTTYLGTYTANTTGFGEVGDTIEVSSKTTFYLLLKTAHASVTQLKIYGSLIPSTIKVRCAYL